MLDLTIGTRLLIFVLGWALGFWFVLKPLDVVRIIGKSQWSEAHFPGGTFGAVQAFGIGVIVMTGWILFKG